MFKLRAPFWGWALSSAFIGLGFTFFSGATEAWLVDALKFSGYDGALEPVFARGQIRRRVLGFLARCSPICSNIVGGLPAKQIRRLIPRPIPL